MYIEGYILKAFLLNIFFISNIVSKVISIALLVIYHRNSEFDVHCIVIFPALNDGKIQWSTSSFENVTDFCHVTQLGHILSIHVPA